MSVVRLTLPQSKPMISAVRRPHSRACRRAYSPVSSLHKARVEGSILINPEKLLSASFATDTSALSEEHVLDMRMMRLVIVQTLDPNLACS